MALLASRRCSLELNFVSTRRRLVAAIARHGPMGPEQWELCLAVVKTPDFYPRLGVVACFAPKGSPIRPAARHAVAEFSVVRIGMAGRATAIFKMEGQNFVGRVRDPLFVAIVAGNGYVRACQWKLAFSMLGNGKQRAMEVPNRMAAFAAIIVRCSGELTSMDVFVAVHAVRKFHLVNSGLAGGNVAFRAFDLGVLAFQRVARTCVLLHPKQRWFPAFDGVTLRALSLFRAACELTLVDVLMAVGAVRE